MRICRVSGLWGEGYAVVEQGIAHMLSGSPFEKIEKDGRAYPLDSCRLLAPVLPEKIVAAGLNYRDHILEMQDDVREEPVIFLKPPTAVLPPFETIPWPKGVDRVDYEAELAVVIGKTAKDVSEGRAPEYIFGYTCANDVTARTIQKKDGQWARAKGYDGFCPVGPYIETEISPKGLSVGARLNGRQVQSSTTSYMIWDVYQLVSFVSSVMTLKPGDLILTGTPSGIGPMQPGDAIEISVSGVGVLQSTMGERKE